MDRSTKVTLSTYNTCVERSRLQSVCELPRCCVARSRCNPNQDSDLEAFSRNPTDGSFAAVKNRLTAFTIYPNEVFLSY